MSAPPHTFPSTHRLHGKETFGQIYSARVRESRGPIVIYAKPNNLPHPRMGLSISRRVGTAPIRNRIKRLLRESFRLMQHDFPRGYDWIVIARPHEPLSLSEYQQILNALMAKLHTVWEKREKNKPE